jgi:23S rRNA pseudouridine1911/1915/1917 synthase
VTHQERTTSFTASPGRLDVQLTEAAHGLSRTRVQALIRQGFVQVDGLIRHKPGMRLEGGESIEARIPASSPPRLQGEAIPLDVVFESADVLIVNKPPGMVVHPSAGHSGGTLVHAALAHAPDLRGVGGEERPGVVHRLDKDTSGLIVLAKDDAAHHWLQRQFHDRQVVKTYLAIVDGAPPTPTGRIEAPIGRDPRRRKRMAVVPGHPGRPATTIFHIQEQFAEQCLLRLEPLTGRTHQVRVHLAFIGCPVTGDRVYGARRPALPVSRHQLHAWRLELVLPGEGLPRKFEAPLPDDMRAALSGLRVAGVVARQPEGEIDDDLD